MGKKLFTTILFVTYLLALLTGCQKNNKYYLERFPKHLPSQATYKKNITGVNLTLHKFSSQECKDYFRVDLPAKGIIPLHLKIYNKSNNIYTIRPSYINLMPAQPIAIAKLLHWNTYSFVSTAGYLSFMFWWPGLFIVGQAGYDMYQNNREIDKLIEQHALAGQVLDILPFEVIEKFIFLQEEDFKPCFKIKMFNQTDKHVITFDVKI